MIGKYLHLADKCIKRFKPFIEERLGVKLEEIIAKDICIKPGYIDDAYNDVWMTVSLNCPDSIFINQNEHERYGTPLSKLSVQIVHEISHLAHDRILDEKDRKKLWRKNKSFGEGFAEYMALDYLIDVYNRRAFKKAVETKNVISQYRNDFPKDDIPYERGYKFFKKVLNIIGKDKVFDVARSPPVYEAEVKIPLLYLLRRYPAKGIKNIPKFFIKGLRTKIIKKRYGFAPFDFHAGCYKAIHINPSQ